jgi:hypothetical protein
VSAEEVLARDGHALRLAGHLRVKSAIDAKNGRTNDNLNFGD